MHLSAVPLVRRTRSVRHLPLPFRLPFFLPPIHLPIFQMESVLPIVLMDGIFLECDVVNVSNNNPFRLLDSVLKERSPIFNPRVESVDIAATAETTWTNGSTATAFNLKFDNGMFNVEHCPFVVGSKVNLVKLADNLDTIDSSLDATITELSTETNKIKLTFTGIVNGTGSDIDFTAHTYALYDVGVKEDTTFSADFDIARKPSEAISFVRCLSPGSR